MNEEERQLFLKALAKRKKEALKNKETAIKYLKEVGFLTENGNVKARYKSACIPKEVV